MDTFFEYLVKRKKNSKDLLFAAGVILGGLIVLYLLLFLMMTPFSMLMFPLQVLVVYLGWRLISSRNVEFEYCVTNGDLDVDKIINRQKRKRLASVETKNVIVMAPVGSDKLQPLANKEIIDATSGDASKKAYCVIYGDSGNKALLFEPKESMVLEMQRKNPRNIFID